VVGVEDGVMTVAEHAEDGSVKKEHKLPFKYSMVIPAFKGVDAVAAVPELCNPRVSCLIRRAPALEEIPEHLLRRRLRRDSARRGDPGADLARREPAYMIESDGQREYCENGPRPISPEARHGPGHLENAI